MVRDRDTQKKSKISILFFGDCGQGAIGIINRDIKSTLEKIHPEIEYELLDWSILDNYEKFFNQKHWKEHDLIIVDPALLRVVDSGWLLEQQDLPLFKSKLIPIYHTEIDINSSHFNHGWYEGWFTTPIAGINKYIVEQIKQKQSSSVLLPIGVNTGKFFPFKSINRIQRIGFIGNDSKEDWRSIKRPDMFLDICKKANIEPVIISGREHGKDIYEDVDAVICTSTVEGLPTAFAEVVACKTPFISTKVGIVREYPNVKTFETVDQAVEIIQHLNKDISNIQEYVEQLYKDVIPERSWENILEDYWIPYFYELHKYQTQPFITTIQNYPYSTVHTKYKHSTGVIIDVGCLGWDWSSLFLKDKQVIGVDPQETTTPQGAELFKGVLSPFDGKIQLNPSGIGAQISSNGEGEWYNSLCWKSFCKKYQIQKVSILKLNIEGAEYALLASMDKEDFNKIEQIAVSFHDWLYPDQVHQKQAILKLLQDNGYTLMETFPTWGWWLAYR